MLFEKAKIIIKHYGEDKQKDIAIEEMAELTKAIIKTKREPNNIKSIRNYEEELADVYLMIMQLISETNHPDYIYKLAEKKADRTIKRGGIDAKKR